MATFAKLGINGKVIAVHSVSDADCLNADGKEDESVGIQFLENLHGWPLWAQTSYGTYSNKHKYGRTPFRGNHASVGHTWDEENQIFWEPQPYESWVKDVSTASWVAPTAKPNYTEAVPEFGWYETKKRWEGHTGWFINLSECTKYWDGSAWKDI